MYDKMVLEATYIQKTNKKVLTFDNVKEMYVVADIRQYTVLKLQTF